MKRLSLVCAKCQGNDFESEYAAASADGSWEVDLVCRKCGCMTMVAVTKDYQPEIDCVNEPRNPYYPGRREERSGAYATIVKSGSCS